jgi:hypothetical protein
MGLEDRSESQLTPRAVRIGVEVLELGSVPCEA